MVEPYRRPRALVTRLGARAAHAHDLNKVHNYSGDGGPLATADPGESFAEIRTKGLAPVASELLFYAAPDGAVKVPVLFRDETAWLTQKALAELFGVNVPAINKHLKNIYESGELERAAAISKMEIAQSEGGRKVAREVELYNLDAIIAVGYRVNSYQATQFRIWATKTLRELLIKGLVLDNESKHDHGWDREHGRCCVRAIDFRVMLTPGRRMSMTVDMVSVPAHYRGE